MRVAAARDHRTIANFIKLLMREHCERMGIGTGQELKRQPTSR